MRFFKKPHDPIESVLPRRSFGAALKALPARAGAGLHSPTAHYGGIQGAYCALICAVTGFYSVFLLEYGVTISQIGFVMALLNSLSVLIQIVAGSFVGKENGPSLRAAVAVMTGAAGVMSVGLFLILGRSTALLVGLFVASGVLTMSMQPLITSLAMEHINRGSNLSFGMARGLGSVAYAVASLILGRVTASFGTGVLPLVHVGMALVTIALVWSFKPPERAVHVRMQSGQVSLTAEGKDSLGAFIKRYKRFFLFLIGVMCLTLCARVVGINLFKIVQGLGGTSSELGVLAAIAALVEFPVMAGFTRLSRRFGCTPLMRLGGVFYSVKAACLIFAPSIPLLYLANSLQVFAYAVFLPAFTYYINALMEDRDRVRGQSFGMAAMTVGDVLGALLCGMLPADIPMRTMLVVGLSVSVIGSVMAAVIPGKLAEEMKTESNI